MPKDYLIERLVEEGANEKVAAEYVEIAINESRTFSDEITEENKKKWLDKN